jgi:hypothetical protein
VFKPPEIQKFCKSEPNSQFREKYIHKNLIGIRGSLNFKLSGSPDEGYHPHIPVLSVLCAQLESPPPPRTQIPGYATVSRNVLAEFQEMLPDFPLYVIQTRNRNRSAELGGHWGWVASIARGD